MRILSIRFMRVREPNFGGIGGYRGELQMRKPLSARLFCCAACSAALAVLRVLLFWQPCAFCRRGRPARSAIQRPQCLRAAPPQHAPPAARFV